MSRVRRMFTATQKADIVRRHLKDRIPVSQLAEELNLQPTQIHTWVQTALAQLERAFEKNGGKGRSVASKTEQQTEKKVQQLEAKLNLKNEVISELMEEFDVEIVLQRALEITHETWPDAKPRIISDNGPQFIANDFKLFLRLYGLAHARTSPYYPQSNGKKERWFGTLKSECIRMTCPQTVDEAKRPVAEYVQHYNQMRLHSAIGYVTPADKLAGREPAINQLRDQKLEAAREQRRLNRLAARQSPAIMAEEQLASLSS